MKIQHVNATTIQTRTYQKCVKGCEIMVIQMVKSRTPNPPNFKIASVNM